MRIVSGKFRSRIINAPEGLNTRPSSDKTRESIFNIIAPYVYDANVLDIFAGSGALGLEAISRGASHATFIDLDDKAIKCIKSNIEILKVSEQCDVINDDYKVISTLKGKSYDLILLDPPYKLVVIDEIISLIDEHSLLSNNGIIVFESNEENSIKKDVEGYKVKVKKYGIAYVNILYKID